VYAELPPLVTDWIV
jgi:hypothetical protein